MAKSKVFWITRDDKGTYYDRKIYVWRYRAYPKKNASGEYTSHALPVWNGCAKGLKPLTGITLAPGQREKYQLVKKE